MADAARREARRRRILENSENRLQKITGKAKENAINDRSIDDTIPTKSNFINGLILPKTISAEIVNQTNDFEQQDKNSVFKEFKNLESQELNATTNHCKAYNQYSLKNKEDTANEMKTNRDNLELNSSYTSSTKQSIDKQLPQDIYSYNMFFSPMSLVILAACLNILVLLNVHFSAYMGIVMPCTILIVTRLCLGKFEDIPGSTMLLAALILCNIKAEIVHTFKKVISYLDIIVKDFALYITSFVFINLITSIFFYNPRQIQFF